MPTEDRHINFKLMRDRLLASQETEEGPRDYWRSLEEFASSPDFQEFVQREYPQQAESWDDPLERRTFLKLMGASLALAGLSGCVYQPPEKIVPYVRQPEDVVPGKPLFFATAATFVGGIATPLLVRSNEGRPTKAEGNPTHPNSRSVDLNDPGSSATDLFSQASILDLYDPDRSQTLTYREEIRTWTTFVGEMRTALDEQRPKQGAGIRFLTQTVTSPTLSSQLRAILTEFPAAKWHQYEPVNDDNARSGAILAFGQPVNTLYNFDKADRVLALDSDFLACLPGTLKYARDFAARRRITEDKRDMSRLYVVESTPTITGANADHRWSVRPSELESAAKVLATKVGVAGLGSAGSSADSQTFSFDKQKMDGLEVIVKDLQQHRGSSIVIAGREASPLVHALAHAMNSVLGNVGKTVVYTDPLAENSVDQRASVAELVGDVDKGLVEILVIVGGNPVYNTPADLNMDFRRLSKVKLRVHLSSHRDETSEVCHWHIPQSHFLEAWSDTRSYDGTVTIVQPLIEPLYQSKSAHELLTVFSPNYDRTAYDLIRAYWQGSASAKQNVASSQQTSSPGNLAAINEPAASASADFETWWRKCLHDGFIPNTGKQPKSFPLKNESLLTAARDSTLREPRDSYELVFRPDPSVYDGRFANNGWLQELPKPLTKLTWDNAALISPNTAKRLGLENTIGWKGGNIWVNNIKVEHRGRFLTCATWIMPGQPDNVVTLHLGYGRKRAGRVGSGRGFNSYELRTSDSAWTASGIKVDKTEGQTQLAVTQIHFNMEGRDILRTATLDEYLNGRSDNEREAEKTHVPSPDETLYGNEHKYEGYAWGMAIDANSCVGCNACIVACQAENNIPVVGKEQVIRSREMHWLRVDTYFKGDDPSNPEGPFFMPVPCMHCENAPCEPVCPVHATVHSAEGINEMVYNRCVGTRYCSNNCPYKVRRFNFLLYQDWDTPTYQIMRNPEVTVRSRGVMEKCTYCVQRIQEAKVLAELEDRAVRDGDIVTACQAACPTEAIIFGNINDPRSRVAKLKAEPRNYALLAELNTRPRTTYLSSLRNPNPEIPQRQ